IALSTAAAARVCASLHKPYRSTKLRANDRRLCEDMLLPDVLPAPAPLRLTRSSPARRTALVRIGSLPIAAPVVRRTDTINGRRSGHRLCSGRIEDDWWGAPFFRSIDRRPQQSAIGDNRLVGLTEVLLASVGDRPHGLTSPLIVDVNVGAHPSIRLALLLVRVETVIVALILARNVVRQFIELQALAPHLVLVDRRSEAGEDRVPIVRGIVYRHMPLGDRHLAAHRNDEGIWENQIRHPDMGVLRIDLTQGQYTESEIGRFDIDARSRKLAHYFCEKTDVRRTCALDRSRLQATGASCSRFFP